MKPLVIMPIVKGQIHQRAMDAMYALEWDGQLDILLLIGGDDPPTGIPGDDTRVDNIVRKYNAARDIALSMGYDALFTLESDILAPPDALKRLAAVDADVAYGLYVWQSIWHHWNAYWLVEEEKAKSVSESPEMAEASWGKVIEVAGLGNGCTLIRRRVLEAFPFRKSDIWHHPPDRSLAMDCQDAGFVQKCDLGLICGHIQRDPVPLILWPDITRFGFYRATDVGEIPSDLVTNELIYLKDAKGEEKRRLLAYSLQGGNDGKYRN